MINLLEQTQGTNLPSVPRTAKLTLTQPFHTANNTLQQTQRRLRLRNETPPLRTSMETGYFPRKLKGIVTLIYKVGSNGVIEITD